MPTSSLIRPKPLLPGGTIAVLAISSPSDPARIEDATAALRAFGYDAIIAGNVGSCYHNYLAGDDRERLNSLNDALRNDAFDAFFFARGGYGAMRILDGIDYDALRRNPRPVVGFSDLTALHQAIAVRAGVATFHGPMLNLDFHVGLTLPMSRWCFDLLTGAAPHTFALGPEHVLAPGEAEGTLFGGCLSLTAALLGTPFDYWVDDGIWFWEDVGEPIYRLDRLLTTLRLSGRLDRIRGVIIGTLKDCGPDPQELSWLLQDFFGSLGVPVVRDLPFGHIGDNLLMPFGARVILNTTAGGMTFPDPVVESTR